MMRNVRLEYFTENSDWDERTQLVVYVDDKELYRGHYGGEPEDNSHYRDYSWVRDAMGELAKELGAEVTLSSKEVEADE